MRVSRHSHHQRQSCQGPFPGSVGSSARRWHSATGASFLPSSHLPSSSHLPPLPQPRGVRGFPRDKQTDKLMGWKCENGLGGSSPSNAQLRLETLLWSNSLQGRSWCPALFRSGKHRGGLSHPSTGCIPSGATSPPPSALLLASSPSIPSLATLSVFNRAEGLEATASLPWVRPLSWDSQEAEVTGGSSVTPPSDACSPCSHSLLPLVSLLPDSLAPSLLINLTIRLKGDVRGTVERGDSKLTCPDTAQRRGLQYLGTSGILQVSRWPSPSLREENRALRADGAGRSTAVQPGQAPEGHHVAAPTEEGSAWLQSSAVWAGEGTGGGKQSEDTSDTMAVSGCLSLPEAMPRQMVTNQPGESPAPGVGGEPRAPRSALRSEGKLWRRPRQPWEPRCRPTWTPSSPAATAAEPRHFHPGCRGNRLPVTSGKRTALITKRPFKRGGR